MNQMLLDYLEEKEMEQQKPDNVQADVKKVTYCTVKFTAGWLPGTIGLTDQAKSAIAAARGTDKRAIRGSYAILGASRDKLIKEGAALKRLLSAIRDEYTIPEYTLRSTAGQIEEKPHKLKGNYLIESAKVEEFLQRFNEVREQYLAWGRRVTEEENYERIKENDREMLQKDWEIIENRYPSRKQLADAINCDMPKIEPFDASFTLEDVAPETVKMLREQAKSRLEASVDGATAELIVEFKNMIEAVARNCGNRVRLMPHNKNPDLKHAEVIKILSHEDLEDVPEGKLLVTVQRTELQDAENKKFKNVGKPEDLLLTEEEYKELNPYETDSYRQLAQSSFENLTWMAKRISTVKNLLADADNADEAKKLTDLAEEVESCLREMGGSAAEVTKQIRGSSFARKSAKKTFNQLFERLKEQEYEIKTRTRKRRQIRLGGTGE